MSAHRDELHHLIDSLPEEQVDLVLRDVRRRTQRRVTPPDSAFAWIGSFSGPVDLSTTPNILRASAATSRDPV